MHVRRALLLFALVLGLAAMATAISQTPPQRRERGEGPGGRTPTAAPRDASDSAPGPVEIRFPAADRPVRRRLETGRSATVRVEVEEPGQVELRGLGLTSYAEPLTPARFDVLAGEPASVGVWLAAAGTTSLRRLGTLEVVAPKR